MFKKNENINLKNNNILKEKEKEKEKEKKNKNKNKIEKNDKEKKNKENELDILNKKIIFLKKEKSNFEDKFLREKAEIINMSKRFINEKKKMELYKTQNFIMKLLTIIDNFEQVIMFIDKNKNNKLSDGILMILKNLNIILKEEGVKEINEINVLFNPFIHNVVQVVVDKNKNVDTVIKILQKGYKLHERILRPASVIITKK